MADPSVHQPPLEHLICAGRLVSLLTEAAPADLEAVRAVAVRAADQVTMPDVVVAETDVLLGDTEVLLPEQTCLVAEVVSPGSHWDHRGKPRIYAEAGIPTFLRVELTGTAAPCVEVLHLRDGAYTLVAKANAGQILRLTEPFPVAFDPAVLLGRRSR